MTSAAHTARLRHEQPSPDAGLERTDPRARPGAGMTPAPSSCLELPPAEAPPHSPRRPPRAARDDQHLSARNVSLPYFCPLPADVLFFTHFYLVLPHFVLFHLVLIFVLTSPVLAGQRRLTLRSLCNGLSVLSAARAGSGSESRAPDGACQPRASSSLGCTPRGLAAWPRTEGRGVGQDVRGGTGGPSSFSQFSEAEGGAAGRACTESCALPRVSWVSDRTGGKFRTPPARNRQSIF